MTADRALLTLQRLAERQAKCGPLREAHRAARAYRLLGDVRSALARDPRQRQTVAQLLRAVGILRRSNRPQRPAVPRAPGRPQAFSDAELRRAIQQAGSQKAAARQLRVNRSTIARRLAKMTQN